MGYWNTSHIKYSPYRDAYHDALRGGNQRLKLSGFASLLRGKETAIVCAALDHYSACTAMERHGIENLFASLDAGVLAQARRLLRQTPTVRCQEPHALEEAANHASATAAILNLAGSEDAEILERTMRNSHSGSARLGAVLAASSVLIDEPDGSRNGPLLEALGEILLKSKNPYEERSAALSAMPEATPDQSFEFVIRATAADDPRIQAQAAMILVEEDISLYGGLAERVAASWADDAPHPAAGVRDMLREHRFQRGLGA